jgi:hypothetical protein
MHHREGESDVSTHGRAATRSLEPPPSVPSRAYGHPILRLQRSIGNAETIGVIRGRAALQRQGADNKGSDQAKAAKLPLVNHYDLEYRPQFEALFAGYSKAVLTVTSGINSAVNTYKQVQAAAAAAEKVTTDAFILLLGAASAELGVLALPAMTTSRELQDAFKELKAVCDLAKAGVSFAPNPAKPALPTGGAVPPGVDPVQFLSDNLSQIEGVREWMNTLFAEASEDLDDPNMNWTAFDPEHYRQAYQSVLDIATAVLKVDNLTDSQSLAQKFERYMWAAYLKPKEDLRYAGSGPSLDFPVMERLTSIGVAKEAGVTFPESAFQTWYKQPEPKGTWGSLLLNWAQGVS